MKRSLRNLKDYTVETQDGQKGKVKDFLFDEDRWIIRYLDVDFGSWMKDKRVLIPRVFLEKPDWENKNFPVKLDNDLIDKCPTLDEKAPVSREFEEKLNMYYQNEYYWMYSYSLPMGNYAFFPSRPLNVPTKQISEDDIETKLRSFKEIKGYTINASDDKLGHVEDIIVDDIDWQLVYLVVDTSNWRPWSKKVLISVTWLTDISYALMEVSVDLHTETIKNAPEFDAGHPVDVEYEKNLFGHYEKDKKE
ncbi:MAG: PRC-barrel domain-containing protein [Bacteroidales bacterium]